MDYPCAKFGNFSFSRFGFIMQTNTLTQTQNHTQTQKIAILTQLPSEQGWKRWFLRFWFFGFLKTKNLERSDFLVFFWFFRYCCFFIYIMHLNHTVIRPISLL